MNAIAELAGIQHLAQDLRAESHRVPEELRPLLRRAALVCDEYVQLRAAVGEVEGEDQVRPAPFPPPEDADDALSGEQRQRKAQCD